MSDSQLKLKSEIKIGTEVTLNLPWNVISDSNDKSNYYIEHFFILGSTIKIKIKQENISLKK